MIAFFYLGCGVVGVPLKGWPEGPVDDGAFGSTELPQAPSAKISRRITEILIMADFLIILI